MTRDDLLTLADRVEKLEWPSREVDALVWLAVCPPDYVYGLDQWMASEPAPASQEQVGQKFAWWIENNPSGAADMYKVRRYTASLDSAMTLVPEGWRWEVGNWPPRAHMEAPNYNPDTYNGYSEETLARTPALALTSASLRAIAERVG